MGTIEKRKEKTNYPFRARVRKGIFRSRGITKCLATKGEAKQWIRLQESNLDKGLKIRQITSYPNLKTLIERYLLEVSVNKKSYKTDKDMMSSFLKGFDNIHIPIDVLTADMFGKYRNHFLKTHKPSYYRRIMSTIKNMWKIARTEWGYPLDNIFENMQRVKNSPPRDRRLTLEEETKILKGNHTDYDFRNIINLALSTALRVGEISKIRKEHICESKLLIPERKNGAKNAYIPLSKSAQQTLKQMKFPLKLSKNGIQTRWKRLMKKYEIRDLRFHDLRHEAISRYLENDVSIPDVQVLSWHKDVRVLMSVYANLRADKVAEKLNY